MKEITKGVWRQGIDWGKIFVNHIPDKQFVFRIYKEVIVRRGDYRNYYKGHMDQIKGEGGDGGGGVRLGWGGGMGRKGIQL